MRDITALDLTADDTGKHTLARVKRTNSKKIKEHVELCRTKISV